MGVRPLFATALALVLGAACAKPFAVPTQADETTRGLSICWHPGDEGDGAVGRALLSAIAARLKRAGYSLVEEACELQIGWGYSTKTIAGDDSFREVTMAVRDARGALIDKVDLKFGDGDAPSDEPDRVAILLANALNASPKVREYGRQHGGGFHPSPDRGF